MQKKMEYLFQKIKKVLHLFQLMIIYFIPQQKVKVLENPKNSAPEFIFQRTISPEKAPNKPTSVTINFKNGDPIGINGKKLHPAKLLEKLNQLAGKNGIGRVDLVENRFLRNKIKRSL